MALTAIFQDAVQRDGRWAYSIVFTDGQQKVLKEYVSDVLTDAIIKQTAIDEVARLGQVAVDAGKLLIRPGAVIDLTPDVPIVPTPTPEELAQAAFFVALRGFEGAQRAVALGLIDVADKRVTDAKAALQAAWLDSYLPLL